jgi:hypothetical protein
MSYRIGIVNGELCVHAEEGRDYNASVTDTEIPFAELVEVFASYDLRLTITPMSAPAPRTAEQERADVVAWLDEVSTEAQNEANDCSDHEVTMTYQQALQLVADELAEVYLAIRDGKHVQATAVQP